MIQPLTPSEVANATRMADDTARKLLQYLRLEIGAFMSPQANSAWNEFRHQESLFETAFPHHKWLPLSDIAFRDEIKRLRESLGEKEGEEEGPEEGQGEEEGPE